MEDIQQSQLIFYLPITASYAVACAVNYYFYHVVGITDDKELSKPDKPFLELILALIAAVGIFAIGRLYSASYLIPSAYNPTAWIVNNLIIYSPIFIVLIFRKHPMKTIWLSARHWPWKISLGILSAVIAVSVFLALRSEWTRWPEVVVKSLSTEGLSNFVAIFLEGVAVAFLFVRLKWATNLKMALLIPAILFAAGHLPGMIADGDPWWHMALMSFVTGAITMFVMYTCYRTKDIIWIGIVHYFLDAAINAF